MKRKPRRAELGLYADALLAELEAERERAELLRTALEAYRSALRSDEPETVRLAALSAAALSACEPGKAS